MHKQHSRYDLILAINHRRNVVGLIPRNLLTCHSYINVIKNTNVVRGIYQGLMYIKATGVTTRMLLLSSCYSLDGATVESLRISDVAPGNVLNKYVNKCVYILYLLSLLKPFHSLVEHTPLTNHFHRARIWAYVSSSFHFSAPGVSPGVSPCMISCCNKLRIKSFVTEGCGRGLNLPSPTCLGANLPPNFESPPASFVKPTFHLLLVPTCHFLPLPAPF